VTVPPSRFGTEQEYLPDVHDAIVSSPPHLTLVRTAHPSVTSLMVGAGERVLVVDDEPDIVALVGYHLAKNGFRVSTAATGPDALRAATEENPALIVLDRMLPGMTGDEVLMTIRGTAALRDTPVLMLTARRDEADRVRGLSLGADDYLTKPFSTQELVLRVGAILRRARTVAPNGDVVCVGLLAIDRAHHRVTMNGLPVDLTATEFKLLLTLALRRGRVQSRSQLLEDVWEAAPDVQTRTVDMHVQRLRAKLGEESDLIETIRGFGYRLRTLGPTL
jgi:two-component system phosphate regulon response regulator PhoB